MNRKNKIVPLIFFVLFGYSCNRNLFVKKGDILKHATGFMFEYRNYYFFYKNDFDNKLNIDQAYIFEKIKKRAIAVEGLSRKEEIYFYEHTKCLPSLFLNSQYIENDSLKINYIDTIKLVPITLNYFIDDRSITGKKDFEVGYNNFYIMKDVNLKEIKPFNYERTYLFKNNSFKINFEVMRLRPQDSICVFR